MYSLQGKGVIMKSNQSNQTDYFIVRLKVEQRGGQLSLPHLGITKTEKNRTKT